MRLQHWIYTVPLRLRSLFRRRQVEQELDEELQYHLERKTEEYIAQGLTPEDAHYAALRAMEGLDQQKEQCRDMRRVTGIEHLIQDLRYGLRMLAKSPGFTVVAVLTLALGIGANTAIFTLIDAVMFRLLPVQNPQQLVLLSWYNRSGSFPLTYAGRSLGDGQGRSVNTSFAHPFVEQLRSQNQVFSSAFGYVPFGMGKENIHISVDGQASMADGVMVTGAYFSGLGISPLVGRMIADTDLRKGAPHVAVISHGFWARQFGSAPSVVGKGITLNGVPFTIVGVTPREFFGVEPDHAPDIWLPLVPEAHLGPWGAQSNRASEMWTRPDWWWVMVVARVKPGVSHQQALAAANVAFLQSATAAAKAALKPAETPQVEFLPASRGLQTLRNRFSKPLQILMTLVGLVLLIACANVATLLLSRAASRRKEIGVRLTLGASRLRLIRQFLTESVLLSATGGALGLLFAHWGGRALLLLMTRGGQAIPFDPHPNLTVLGFTSGVSVLTGILFGLAPAIHAARVDLLPVLKNSARGLPESGSHLRLGSVLVILQVALSLVLLVGAGLFVRTLMNLENQDLGFNRSNLLVFKIDPAKSGYEGPRVAEVFENLRERLQEVPGIQGVTLSGSPLLTGWGGDAPISIEGNQLKTDQWMQIEMQSVGPEFCKTMGMKLVLGREIDRKDTPSSHKVAVIDAGVARHFFGNSNPIGRRFCLDETFDPTKAIEIVGVVQSTTWRKLRAVDPKTVYFPYTQVEGGAGSMYFEVRTAGDPLGSIPAVRSAIHGFNANLVMADVRSQTQIMAESLTRERLLSRLSSFFGMVALLLSCIGLYGLMAYSVSRRTNEIGIRMALGAQRMQVLSVVLRHSLVLVAVGVMVGLLATTAATRLIASELYGLKPTDPVTLGWAAFFIIVVTAFAAYLPAHRATKVDPMVALRCE